MESTTLYFKQGSSDKVYQASISEKDGGYIVQFSYGRRGSALTTGTKTPTAVNLDAARAIYDKLIKEKIAKGYVVGKKTGGYEQPTWQRVHTGIHCQLLTPIAEDEVEQFIADPAYWAQEKHDGRRLLIKKEDGKVIGISKLGFPVSLPQSLKYDASLLGREFVIDGELIGDTLMVFDLLSVGGRDVQTYGYAERNIKLVNLLATTRQYRVQHVTSTFLPLQKRQLLEQLKADRKEGIVFKHFDAQYTPGRSALQFKFKFYDTASCIVGKVNDKRSVGLLMVDGENLVSVGNVTISANHEIPNTGGVVECRYLYAYKGGSLYQPVYLGQREDVAPAECTIDQLKYKPEVQAA